MKLDENAEISVGIPRAIINKILHHAQLSVNACGFITRKANDYQCHQLDIDNRSLNKPSVAERLQLITPIVEVDPANKLFALYQAYREEFSDEKIAESWNDLPADILFLMVSMSLKGVLEVKAYQFFNKRIKKVVLELDVL